ncbi:MAG: hypothetical protein WCA21_06830 [Terracidiphilus sp.]
MPNKPESKHQLVSLWELVSGEKRGENPLVNLWELVSRCKTRAGYIRLWKHARFRHSQLERLTAQSVAHCHTLDGRPVSADTILSEVVAAMYAIGFVRGMQLGRELERDRETGGTVGLLLKHAPVRHALLHQPEKTTEEICEVLDNYDVELPGKLRGQGTWGRFQRKPLVKVAISNARKAAIQEAMFAEFMAVAKGVGHEGSIVNQFRLKKFGYPQ